MSESKQSSDVRRIEVLILCGCSICGRRLIENGKRIEGIHLLMGACIAREVWCPKCAEQVELDHV